MNLQGTTTGRYGTYPWQQYSRAIRWPQYKFLDLSKTMRDWNKMMRNARIKIKQHEARARRSALLALKGHDKRSVMTERNAVESLVRRKNNVYRKWRKKFKYPTLDSTCAEILMVFGELPDWEEYVQCRRRGQWKRADEIQLLHREWKNDVRDWVLKRGITTYPHQSAQFLKFYFAWYRYQWEKRHGAIERQYARQMQ